MYLYDLDTFLAVVSHIIISSSSFCRDPMFTFQCHFYLYEMSFVSFMYTYLLLMYIFRKYFIIVDEDSSILYIDRAMNFHVNSVEDFRFFRWPKSEAIVARRFFRLICLFHSDESLLNDIVGRITKEGSSESPIQIYIYIYTYIYIYYRTVSLRWCCSECARARIVRLNDHDEIVTMLHERGISHFHSMISHTKGRKMAIYNIQCLYRWGNKMRYN